MLLTLVVWASFSGPPVALYYLATETSTRSIKGLLTGYFLLLYVFTAGGLVLDGEYGRFTGWTVVLTGACTIAALYPLAKGLARCRALVPQAGGLVPAGRRGGGAGQEFPLTAVPPGAHPGAMLGVVAAGRQSIALWCAISAPDQVT